VHTNFYGYFEYMYIKPNDVPQD